MNIRSIQCPSCGSNPNVESVNQALFKCEEAMTRGEIPDNYIQI